MRKSIRFLGGVSVAAALALSAPPSRTFAAEGEGPPRWQPAEFAYGVELTAKAGLAVQSFPLPIEVLRSTVRDDHGDLFVFDAEGAPVPHALWERSPGRERVSQSERAPFFPILARPGGAAPDLSLSLQRGEDGTLQELHVNSVARREATDAGLVAWIFDLSRLERPYESLHLEIRPTEPSFVLPVRVETSEDLSQFSLLDMSASVVNLEYGEDHIQRTELDLGQRDAPYLRVSWGERKLPFALVAASVALVAEEAAPAVTAVDLTGTQHPSEPGRYDFDLGTALDVECLSVELPRVNTFVQATLSRATDLAGPKPTASWLPLHEGKLYRLNHEGVLVTSPPICLHAPVSRHLRLVVDERGGGLGGDVPRLRIEAVPVRLLFLARGQGPFTLAYGHHTASARAFPAAELLSALPSGANDAKAALEASTVVAAAPRELAGQVALVAPPPPAPVKKYVLWGVLVAGVLGVAGLSFRLWRGVARAAADPSE